MQSLWNEEDARQFAQDPLEMRVYSSCLLGREPSLVLHGGGNTSVKSTHIDHFGDTQDIIWVKASGFDLSVMGPEGFTALDTKRLLKCATLKTMSDPDMVNEVLCARLDAKAAGASIEAIAHAKICARTIDTFLMGEERFNDHVLVENIKKTGRKREMDQIEQQEMPTSPLTHRDLPTEVEQGFCDKTSETEAQRCYRCHYKFEIDQNKCILCDVCIKARARPECILQLKEIHRDDEGRVVSWDIAETADDINMIWINQEECIRCNACLEVCPAYAITLQKVSLSSEPSCS